MKPSSTTMSYRMVIGAALSAFALLTAACVREESLPRETQTVEDVTIYLGVVPAALVQGHRIGAGEPNAMHGGVEASRASHHVLVALFDSKTGARIGEARVKATLGDRAHRNKFEKLLEPMHIAGTTTFGNFFELPSEGVWRVDLAIERAGGSHPIKASFGYEYRSHQ